MWIFKLQSDCDRLWGKVLTHANQNFIKVCFLQLRIICFLFPKWLKKLNNEGERLQIILNAVKGRDIFCVSAFVRWRNSNKKGMWDRMGLKLTGWQLLLQHSVDRGPQSIPQQKTKWILHVLLTNSSYLHSEGKGGSTSCCFHASRSALGVQSTRNLGSTEKWWIGQRCSRCWWCRRLGKEKDPGSFEVDTLEEDAKKKKKNRNGINHWENNRELGYIQVRRTWAYFVFWHVWPSK